MLGLLSEHKFLSSQLADQIDQRRQKKSVYLFAVTVCDWFSADVVIVLFAGKMSLTVVKFGGFSRLWFTLSGFYLCGLQQQNLSARIFHGAGLQLDHGIGGVDVWHRQCAFQA